MPGPSFPTTRWTLVLSSAHPDTRNAAIQWLCERYWYPIYAYLRRSGLDPNQSHDGVQGFLAHFLEHRSLESADPNRGRFRSYLLGALKNYLCTQAVRNSTLARGGQIHFLPDDISATEALYLATPPSLSPDALYERQWALSLIERAVQNLAAEHEAAGKSAQFAVLKRFLTTEADYAPAAQSLGLTEGAARVAVHRLRRRFRDILSAEIAETVNSPDDIQREIRYFLSLLSA